MGVGCRTEQRIRGSEIEMPTVKDQGSARDEPDVRRYNSGALIGDATVLLMQASGQVEERTHAALLRACLVVVADATEASALEVAYDLRFDLFADRQFRRSGPKEKWEKLGFPLPGSLVGIWEARVALVHSEPNNRRGRLMGRELDGQGLKAAIRDLVALVRAAWDGAMRNGVEVELRYTLSLLRDEQKR